MAKEIGWKILNDIRPESFDRWLWRLSTSAKTKREYQLSVRAFLNWLIKIDRLERNPLAKLELVSSKGREKRPYRRYSDDELRALFSLKTERVLFYQTLLYTGARKNEVGSLVFSDIQATAGGNVTGRLKTGHLGSNQNQPL